MKLSDIDGLIGGQISPEFFCAANAETLPGYRRWGDDLLAPRYQTFATVSIGSDSGNTLIRHQRSAGAQPAGGVARTGNPDCTKGIQTFAVELRRIRPTLLESLLTAYRSPRAVYKAPRGEFSTRVAACCNTCPRGGQAALSQQPVLSGVLHDRSIRDVSLRRQFRRASREEDR
jgi:hypothetical protein